MIDFLARIKETKSHKNKLKKTRLLNEKAMQRCFWVADIYSKQQKPFLDIWNVLCPYKSKKVRFRVLN